MSKRYLFVLSLVFFMTGVLDLNAQAELLTDTLKEVPQRTIQNLDKTIFKNVFSTGKVGSAKITWSIDYDGYELLKGKELIITYNTEIGAERNLEGFEGSEWKFTKPFPVNQTSYIITDLQEFEKYIFKIGFAKEGAIEEVKNDSSKMVWVKGNFETERGLGIMKLLMLIGALAFFIYGMKVMSDGLQHASGSSLRNMLSNMTSNRIKGVLSGFGITAIIQSSSITTVMTVSFVNAGLMTLTESAGVMMGANIGTTITGWLVLLIGFTVSVKNYALVFMAIAGPFLFMKNTKSKALASAIIGFCILIMGLEELKNSVPELDSDSAIVQFFVNYQGLGVITTLIFVALGTLVTVIIQSSSAAMALTLTMVSAGIIPFPVACAMILGENIGTTITAEIASLIGNVHAKRSARIHSLFNILGVSWMVIVFPLFTQGLSLFMQYLDYNDPFTHTEEALVGLALFHTAFNTTNVLLMLPFTKQLVKLSEMMVKSKGTADVEFRLEYIGSGIMSTPELSILEAKKEIHKFALRVKKLTGFVPELLVETDKKNADQLLQRIAKYEDITDRMEIEIADYLSKTAEGELSEEASMEIRGMLSIVNDLERMGDICFQMSKTIERKSENKVWFTPEQRENLQEMFTLLDEAMTVMVENLAITDYKGASSKKAHEVEAAINQKRDDIRRDHLKNLERGEYNFESGLIYNDLFSSIEKLGDHAINVTEAVTGEV